MPDAAGAPPPRQATVAATVEALQRAGYARAYGVHDSHVRDEATGELFPASDFSIDEVYRFEGETDPADEAIVLALTDLRSRSRGVLVTAYGPAATAEEDAVLAQLLDWRDRT